ncbi:UDP-N-acetylmuramoyl-L-alanyl-D-glutamate--2,6-diaminopimelate ligase [Candidatus Beckwithbacteria bacterium]|nr:UDP-N-acetylmuramoyl-L-alanyl-D-glutamate--2,6-diaminopimelate ligase [Candidatus Beckwithbacteria bacterium]
MSTLTILRPLLPNWLVNTCWHLPKAILANWYYGFPSKNLTIIGVTGTDGKTTTSTMLYHILHKAGYKVALISTVAAKIGKEEIDTGFHVTSPEPWALQKMLKQVVRQGFDYLVLESTSQGLVQNRTWGIKFTGGIVTNIDIDHLDYHKTWENYVKAKGLLFKNTSFAVLNCEDGSYKPLKETAKGKIISYGVKKGDWNLKDTQVKISLIGQYNQLNALAASAAAHELGVDKKKSLKYLESFPGVLGRMQIMYQKDFTVIVDFAHTPNALRQALGQLRPKTKSRLISIFGCAGLRDKARREMGQVSAKLADITVITAEDPRTEGVEAISCEIEAWAQKEGAKELSRQEITKLKTVKKAVYVKIPDRQEAINFGIKIAQKGDIVGIFGKGHEQSMCYGTTETLWTDQEAVKKALKKYGYSAK